MVTIDSFQLRMVTVGCCKLNFASWRRLLLGSWQWTCLALGKCCGKLRGQSENTVLRCRYPKSSSQGMFFCIDVIVFERMFLVSCHCFIIYSISNCQHYCNCQVLMRSCPLCVWFLFPVICQWCGHVYWIFVFFTFRCCPRCEGHSNGFLRPYSNTQGTCSSGFIFWNYLFTNHDLSFLSVVSCQSSIGLLCW